MIPALALAALLAAGPARASAPAAYDAKAAPLDDLSKSLLTENGYALRDDGKVWDKIADGPVARTDMAFLLSRLASARRLRALLEINAIINRYDAERKLTAEDREAVRALVRKNWEVFGPAPRADFRSYFSPEEREALDKIPPRFEAMSPLAMTDPSPDAASDEPSTPPLAGPSLVSPPPTIAPAASPTIAPPPAAAAKAVPTLTPILPPPSLKRDSPFSAPTPPAAAPAVATAPTAAPAPDLGTFKPWTPPAPSTATAAASPAPKPIVAVSTPAAPSSPIAVSSTPAPVVAAPPPPAPEPPKPAEVTEDQYEAFVAAGPYSKEGKAWLTLIAKRGPEFCLPLLRRTVVGAVPQIVLDGARTGAALRAGFRRDPANTLAPPIVAVSPGPVFIEKKSGLFGSRQAVLLPESPDVWADLGAARPALEAWRADAAPRSTENGEWGATKVYSDDSRRGTYSSDEQAGELLEQILLLGLAREGLDVSPYAARRWARIARLLFFARLKDDSKQDGFLDPDRRAELREWLDHPGESDDVTAAVWSGSRLQALDPRRGPPLAERDFDAAARASSCARAALEDALAAAGRTRARKVGTLETLVDAGVLGSETAKAAAQSATDLEETERRRLLAAPPACPAASPERDEALRRSAVLLAESARAERALRENATRGGEAHAD